MKKKDNSKCLIITRGDRISSLDLIKGFTILLVVIGHAAERYLSFENYLDYNLVYELLFKIIYSFHMPLLMIISGYLYYYSYFANGNFSISRYKRHLGDLCVTYFIMSVIAYFAKLLFSKAVLDPVDVNSIFLIVVKPIGHLWYLHILIILYLLNVIILKKTSITNYTYIAVVLCVACLISPFIADGNLWLVLLARIMRYGFYFFIGIILCLFPGSILFDKKNVISCICISIIFLVWALVNDKQPNNTGVIHLIIAYGIAIGIICFVMKAYHGTMSIIEKLGKISLEIYLLHQYPLTAFRVLLTRYCSNGFISILLCVCFTIFIVIVCVKIMEHLDIRRYIFKPYTSFLHALQTKAKQ